MVRDLTIAARDLEHSLRVVDRVRQIPQVKVLQVADRAFQLHLGGKIEVIPKLLIRNRETLTLHRLGMPEVLRRSLCSTNLLESGFATTRDFTDRVKRWRGGDHVQRWAAAALLEGERRWQRVRGYKYLPLLDVALQRMDKRGTGSASWSHPGC